MALVREKTKLLEIDESLLERPVNDGFSGGEKKRNEIFQMAVLEPKLAILDETDSGLDIDALKVVAGGVNALRSPGRAIIVVTHYQRLLNYIVPDRVHVLCGGRIVQSGGKQLALELEEKRIRPLKSDIAVGRVALLWRPWVVGGDGVAEPVFEPSPEQVAARSGYSISTILRHFGGRDGLVAAMRDLVRSRVAEHLAAGPFEGDLHDRVGELVRRLAATFETVAPFLRVVAQDRQRTVPAATLAVAS